MYRYAIIGPGGLGKLHLTNLARLGQERGGDIKLCAICGTTREAFQKSVQLNFGTVDISVIDLTDCNFYQDYKEMIDTERPDFVVSATPTFLHEEIAVYALSKGIHIYSEKPMALTAEGCDKMVAEADKTGKLLVIGQSTRFTPAFIKLREYVQQKTFGKVCRFEFSRYSATPMWTWQNWILDPKQSGGCVLDMHIHDVDFVNWMFGKPQAVRSVGTENKVGLESVFTQYVYEDFMGLGSADWSMPQKFPFTKRFMVNFEKATVEIANGKLVVDTDEETYEPELENEEIHYRAMKTFLEVSLDGKPCDDIISCKSVCASTKIALAEIESIRTGKQIAL